MRFPVLKICILTLLLASGCTGPSIRTVTGADGDMAFVVRAPHAQRVEFVCSCDDFSSQPAKNVGDGTWSVPVPLEQPFTYFFLVDGRVCLAGCDLREKDDFGSEICIYQNLP